MGRKQGGKQGLWQENMKGISKIGEGYWEEKKVQRKEDTGMVRLRKGDEKGKGNVEGGLGN